MKGYSKIMMISILFLALVQVPEVFAQSQDDVLAKVGNDVITRLDLEMRIRSLPTEARSQLMSFERVKQLLEKMAEARLLIIEASQKGLANQPEIKAKLKIIEGDLILAEYVKKYIEKQIEIKEEEAEKVYLANPEYRERTALRVSQIVVEKEKEAKDILERLKKGESFQKLAFEKSTDNLTKNLGGQLEWFVKGEKEKEMEDALAKLEKGGISEIVKLKGEYYIFRLEEKRDIPRTPFAKVKDEIMATLRNKKIAELLNKETEALKKRTQIEIYDEKLKL